MSEVNLRCLCCGLEKGFATAKEAYNAGWDCRPYFSFGPFCDLCPSSLKLLGLSHEEAHRLWEAEGRPTEFTVGKCGSDEEVTKRARPRAASGCQADTVGRTGL